MRNQDDRPGVLISPVGTVTVSSHVSNFDKSDPPNISKSRYHWHPDALEMLGKCPDSVVSSRTGISASAVRYKRMALGIPCGPRGGWNSELIDLLGKIPDKELADRSQGRLNYKNVRTVRLERGIAVCPAPRKVYESAPVKEEVRELLGQISDYEISRRTGVERSVITRQRLELGIPSATPAGRPPRVWSFEEVQMIGVLFDSDIAKKLKISRIAVSIKRKSLGILEPRSMSADGKKGLAPHTGVLQGT
ncbi:hypothetical protein PVE_R2G0107 [Pseudomonas veronii 1YdBTEX2]|uniref:Uncharacterized protein n=2 Tax=Pseudomonas veronii TaxID=76761 RepID=A0A7Y1AAD3_PSEVE|nr:MULTISPECIES: hypothetical protein [Pseudomonas]NMY12090.1 hypothetical protein [Pseudomonas veronii]SBW84137.1 hypothetical protein PVE_R2G0107 [Pseudomonas veronii 1YdBTEX2]